MNQKLFGLFSEIARVNEILQEAPQGMGNLSGEELAKKIETYQKKIASVQRVRNQVVALNKEKFGMPQKMTMPDWADMALQVRYAEQHFNDANLRNLLLVPSKGVFAKKPKENDYHLFCNSTTTLLTYYNGQLSYLESVRDAQVLNGSQNALKLLLGCRNARINVDPDEECWDSYPNAEKDGQELYLGKMEIPVQDFGMQELRMAEVLAGSGEDSWLECPFTYGVADPFSLFISYEGNLREGEEKLGGMLRGIVYQFIRALPAYSYQFIYLDPAHGGSALREINSKLQSARDGNAFRLNEELYPTHQFTMLEVGSTREQVREILKRLDERVGIINSICGGQTVNEFNAPQFDEEGNIIDGGAGVIPQQIVIFDNVHQYLDQGDAQILTKLAECTKKNGISLIVTSIREAGEELSPAEKALIQSGRERKDFDHIQWETDGCSIYFNGLELEDGNDEQLFYNFEPFCEMPAHEAYLDLVSNHFRPTLDMETNYEKRVDIDAVWGKSNGNNSFTIPIGVNERNQVASVTLGGSEGAHALLAGSTGCGKSSYLHTLINGVLIHYKPTDVQIWLSDYKSNEFRRYMENTPPHIRYVGVGRTLEYTFSFLDKMWNEYLRRSEQLGSLGSVAEYRERYGEDSMPRLLIMVDEFHVMANHVKDFPDYKQKLSSLLREARAAGMTFFFADQTCGVGLQGLSEDGKLQLTCRMAMKTTPEEYNAVFNITNSKEVIPVQQNYEVTLKRIEERIDRNGAKSNVEFYEHCKTLFIKPEMRDEVARRAIEAYGPAQNPVFVEDSARGPADWEGIAAEEQKATRTLRGIPMYLGTPLSIQKYFTFRLMSNYGENIMSVTPVEETQASLFASLVESICRQEDTTIYILADENDSLFGLCEPWILDRIDEGKPVRLVTDMGEICETICSLWETMEKRRKQRNYDERIFVFWMGLFDMAREMDYFKNSRPSGSSLKAKEEPDRNGLMDDLNSQFLSLFGNSGEDLSGMNLTPVAPKREEADEDEEEDSTYNAVGDIRALTEEGPKRDIFQIVFHSAVSIAKKTKCAPLDNFTHKIGLAIGKDEATDYFGSSRLVMNAEGKMLDDSTAVYYNGRNSGQFMPFVSGLEEEIRADARL